MTSQRVLILRGELSEREDELRHIESSLENSVNAIICALPLYDLDEIRLESAEAAFEELTKSFNRRTELKKEIADIRSELGQ